MPTISPCGKRFASPAATSPVPQARSTQRGAVKDGSASTSQRFQVWSRPSDIARVAPSYSRATRVKRPEL
jgi:hypothetical protein